MQLQSLLSQRRGAQSAAADTPPLTAVQGAHAIPLAAAAISLALWHSALGARQQATQSSRRPATPWRASWRRHSTAFSSPCDAALARKMTARRSSRDTPQPSAPGPGPRQKQQTKLGGGEGRCGRAGAATARVCDARVGRVRTSCSCTFARSAAKRVRMSRDGALGAPFQRIVTRSTSRTASTSAAQRALRPCAPSAAALKRGLARARAPRRAGSGSGRVSGTGAK